MLTVPATVSSLHLNVTPPKMPLLSVLHWGCCFQEDHLLQSQLWSSHPCLSSRKESGWAESQSRDYLHWKCTARHSCSGLRGSSVNGADEPSASAASPITSSSRGAETAPGILLALGCWWDSSMPSAASHLTPLFPMRCRGNEGESQAGSCVLIWNLKLCRNSSYNHRVA